MLFKRQLKMAKTPNPKFSFLSTGELAELNLLADYGNHMCQAEAVRDKDREVAVVEKREALRARERDKRID